MALTDTRTALHDLVWRLVDAWVDDHTQGFTDACSPDVTWWLPVDGAPCSGRDDVWAVLRDLRVSAGGDLRVDSVITADDGSMAVVEMTATGSGHPPASVTSVLTAEAGLVASGRTYVDVEALPLNPADRVAR